MEEDVGRQLIQRQKGKRAISLTNAGLHFLDIAQRWLEVQEEVHNLRETADSVSLAVGSLASLNMGFMNRIYARLFNREEVHSLNLLQRHSDKMYTLAERRLITVGFALIDLYSPTVYARQCYQEPLFGVRVTDSPQLGGIKTVSVGDLDPSAELYMNWCDSARIWHDHHWGQFKGRRRRLDGVNVICELLREPGQWSIFPYTLACETVKKGHLEMFAITPPPPDRVCYLLTHRFPTPEQQKATGIFMEEFRPELESALEGHGKIFI